MLDNFRCRCRGLNNRLCLLFLDRRGGNGGFRTFKALLDHTLALLGLCQRIDRYGAALLKMTLANSLLPLDLFALLLCGLQLLGELFDHEIQLLVAQNRRCLVLDLVTFRSKVFDDRIAPDVDLARDLEQFISGRT